MAAYINPKIEALGKRRQRVLAQLTEVETELRGEVCRARIEEDVPQERLAALAQVTRATVTKWIRQGRESE